MEPDDRAAVTAIYAEGIATGQATFETDVPPWEAWFASRLPWSRLVALDGTGAVIGWVAAVRKSPRDCYAGVVEHSVYVASQARGRGVGSALVAAFLAAAAEAGTWTVETSIFPENAASVALHERVGFRLVGRRERIARLAGAWRDTLLYELRLPG
jgi:phosphinothricin acetyltransferase